MRTFLRIASFLSLLFGGQFTLDAMAQDELSRVINSNVQLIERNHVRGDMMNARARRHNVFHHNQYGYGYEDGGYFYGTDQYGRGSRGRVHISPIEVGIGGAVIGGSIGGWRGAAIGGTAGYFGTKAVKAIVSHKRSKKEQKEAEAMAAQAEAEYEASFVEQLVRNNYRKTVVRARSGARIVAVLQPGSETIVSLPPGAELWFEGVWEEDNREVVSVIGYGDGKRKLPHNSGWELFDPETEKRR